MRWRRTLRTMRAIFKTRLGRSDWKPDYAVRSAEELIDIEHVGFDKNVEVFVSASFSRFVDEKVALVVAIKRLSQRFFSAGSPPTSSAPLPDGFFLLFGLRNLRFLSWTLTA